MNPALIISSMLLIVATASAALAQQPLSATLELSAPRAKVGDTVTLGIVFRDQQQVSPPDLPAIDGVRVQYLGPATMMSVVNGRASSTVTHRYLLLALKEGTVTLGPFHVTVNGKALQTDSVSLQVIAPGHPATATPAGVSASEDQAAQFAERIILELSVSKDELYVNEPALLTATLYVADVQVSKVDFPNVPDQGFVREKFSQPRQYQKTYQGRPYRVMEFTASLYPTRQGTLTLGPASQRCVLSVRQPRRSSRSGSLFFDDSFFEDFFGSTREYALDVVSNQLAVRVLPHPESNRPEDFQGAVGDYALRAEASLSAARVGDPVTLTIEVSGSGNSNSDSITPPRLSTTEGFSVYQPEISVRPNGKRFVQVIIPENESITEIPALRFSFFDPERRQYRTLTQGPFPLTVSPAPEKTRSIITAAALNGQAESAVGQDLFYIKEQMGPVSGREDFVFRRPWFIPALVAPLLGVVAVGVWQRRRRRLSADVESERVRRAPAVARQGLRRCRDALRQQNAPLFYHAVFKTLQDYIGHRFKCRSHSVTVASVDTLAASGRISAKAADYLRRCFADCDQARYGGALAAPEAMNATLTALQTAIDMSERRA